MGSSQRVASQLAETPLSKKKLPSITQDDYFNYNKKDEFGKTMPPEDGRPVILMSQSSNPKIGYRGLGAGAISTHHDLPRDPYSENAQRGGAGASSRARVQSFSRRQKLTGSAMIIRSNKENSSLQRIQPGIDLQPAAPKLSN